jgi:putative two-component system response regulator
MTRRTIQSAALHETADLLDGLTEIGVRLAAETDRRTMFDGILREARRLSRAKAGNLYVLRHDRLEPVAAQNDRPGADSADAPPLDIEALNSARSLPGHVAATGQVVNIPNVAALAADAPFALGTDLGAAGDFEARSVLALPLTPPGGECLGVLELVNHTTADGSVTAFSADPADAIFPLAAMAAATIGAALAQEDLKASHLDTILRLSVLVERRDHAAADHVRRVSRTSALMARALGLDGRQAEQIEYASPLHDLGKIAVPEAVLLKPEPLTPEERAAIEEHTTAGSDLLGDPQSGLLATARDIILSHHERWDGLGYPRGLEGDEIPLAGRIVAVADAFDALLSRRNHREAYSLAKVLITLQTERGKQFDPAVIDAFFRVLDRVLDLYGLADPTAVLMGTATA